MLNFGNEPFQIPLRRESSDEFLSLIMNPRTDSGADPPIPMISLQLAAAIDRLHMHLETMFPRAGLPPSKGSKVFLPAMTNIIAGTFEQLCEQAEEFSYRSEPEGEMVLQEMRHWVSMLLEHGTELTPNLCDSLVRGLSLMTALLWDIVVERKGANNIRSTAHMSPLTGIFRVTNEQRLEGKSIREIIGALSDRRKSWPAFES
jgi:hypothetical protein